MLDDEARLRDLMRAAAEAVGATALHVVGHRSEAQGVTVVISAVGAHLALHTRPARGYAAADVFTGAGVDPRAAHAVLAAGLGCGASEVMILERGGGPPGESIAERSHSVDYDPIRSRPGSR